MFLVFFLTLPGAIAAGLRILDISKKGDLIAERRRVGILHLGVEFWGVYIQTGGEVGR